MARAVSTQRKAVTTVVAWLIGLALFFPIFWMICAGLKNETDAYSMPTTLFQTPWTLENYAIVQERSDYFRFAMNSVLLSFGSTIIALLFAVPCAWAMAFSPGKRTKDTLLWMLSTKMMPPVGALLPIFLIFKDLRWIDNQYAMIGIMFLLNLPIVIWMLYTYFKEIPVEILEASRMDGATLWSEITQVLFPMALPGIASTFLLNVILSWNEAFWTLNLTNVNAAPLTVFIASYSSPEGQFWAKLSAAGTMAIGPILILGWFAQKQLVRGLTFGAVK